VPQILCIVLICGSVYWIQRFCCQLIIALESRCDQGEINSAPVTVFKFIKFESFLLMNWPQTSLSSIDFYEFSSVICKLRSADNPVYVYISILVSSESCLRRKVMLLYCIINSIQRTKPFLGKLALNELFQTFSVALPNLYWNLTIAHFNIQGGSNMTGTDLCVNKPHCAAAVRPWESEATTSTLPPARVRTCSVLSGSC